MLIDDHDLFRAGLRNLLEGEQVRVVADCQAGPRAVDVARRTRPSVVVIDIARTDGGDNGPLVAELCEALPGLGVIAFTRSLDEPHVYAAVRAGARGYVVKETPVADLAGAIRAVHRGAAALSPDAAAIALGFLRTGRIPRQRHADMSERELDVLRLVARGLDNNQIAEELNISAKTVKNHVSSIFSKLGMTNRVQAAVYAVRSGLA